jgi:uncharacterized protein with FMN-binding domain
LVPALAMIAGIVLPSIFTVLVLSKVAASGSLQRSGAVKPTGGGHNNSPPTPATGSGSGPSGNFSGPVVQGFFGPVQAFLTVANGKITDVRITAPQDNPTSQFVNSQAVPLLRSETLQAQSANINGISGATVTSQAYYQSLLGALKAAGL